MTYLVNVRVEIGTGMPIHFWCLFVAHCDVMCNVTILPELSVTRVLCISVLLMLLLFDIFSATAAGNSKIFQTSSKPNVCDLNRRVFVLIRKLHRNGRPIHFYATLDKSWALNK